MVATNSFPDFSSTYQQLWNYALSIGLLTYEYKSQYTKIISRGNLHLCIILYTNGDEIQKYILNVHFQRKINIFNWHDKYNHDEIMR